MPKLARSRKKRQSNIIPFPKHEKRPMPDFDGGPFNLHEFVFPSDEGTVARVNAFGESLNAYIIETPEGIWWLSKQEVR